MKRLACALLCALFLFCCAACGGDGGGDTKELKSGNAVCTIPAGWETFETAADNMTIALARTTADSGETGSEADTTAESQEAASEDPAAAFADGAGDLVVGLYSYRSEEHIPLENFKEDPTALNELLLTLTNESYYRNEPITLEYIEDAPYPMLLASFVDYGTQTTYLVYFTVSGEYSYAFIVYSPGRPLYSEEVNLAASVLATLQLDDAAGGEAGQ